MSINGKQSVKSVPFKVYADFECNLEAVESYEGSYTQNISRTRSL